MSPDRRAKQLLDSFGMAAGTYMNDLVFGIAKRSALLCVDEILQALAENGVIYPHIEYERAKEYWQQVKSEIEKL